MKTIKTLNFEEVEFHLGFNEGLVALKGITTKTNLQKHFHRLKEILN